jgi:DNA-binding transcriptional LysR family regulator
VNDKGWAGLELRHLRALRAIAETGSFHEAAARLGYTQSAISQQIASLERLVGEKLLVRPGGSRPVQLTPTGELLLRHANVVLSQIGDAKTDLASHRAGEAVRLRVGAFQSVGATIVPALMTQLARRRPEMEIELTQTIADDELMDLLGTGDLDITFAMLPIPEGPFTFFELFSEPFVVLVSVTSPLARNASSVSLRELATHPLITAHECRYTGHLKTLMLDRGLAPNVVHRSDDNATVLGLVTAGAGVALMPKLAAAGAGNDIITLHIEEPVPWRRVGLAWRENQLVTGVRERFTEEVATVCRHLSLTD